MGFLSEVVERWIPRANVRRDFLGCVDILAVQPGLPMLAVQATTAANISSRVKKAVHEPRLRVWLKAGGTFEVWGWHRVGGRWQCRKTPVVLDGLAGIAVIHPIRRKRRRTEPMLFGESESIETSAKPKIPILRGERNVSVTSEVSPLMKVSGSGENAPPFNCVAGNGIVVRKLKGRMNL